MFLNICVAAASTVPAVAVVCCRKEMTNFPRGIVTFAKQGGVAPQIRKAWAENLFLTLHILACFSEHLLVDSPIHLDIRICALKIFSFHGNEAQNGKKDGRIDPHWPLGPTLHYCIVCIRLRYPIFLWHASCDVIIMYTHIVRSSKKTVGENIPLSLWFPNAGKEKTRPEISHSAATS